MNNFIIKPRCSQIFSINIPARSYTTSDKPQPDNDGKDGLTDEQKKKLETVEKLLQQHVIGGRKIQSLHAFRNHVTSHEYPVIVLFKKRDDPDGEKVESQLKKAVIKTKGQFKLCILDVAVVEDALLDKFNIRKTPSLFLFYRANIAQEFRGVPESGDLKEFVRAAQFFHALVTEEMLVTKLIEEGQKCLDTK